MSTGIRFPVDLPVPGRSGYGDTEEPTRSEFRPEVGMGRRRQKYRSTPRIFEVEWTFTQDQYTIFDTWWQETIQGGALPFDIQLLDDDETLSWFTVYWLEEYEAEVVGVMDWRVRGRLRATEATFGTTRPSGTDELNGSASITVAGTGDLLVSTSLRGAASIDITGTGRLKPIDMRGETTLLLTSATGGRIKVGVFRGAATIGVDATGQIEIGTIGYFPELSRQWMGMAWAPGLYAQDISAVTQAVSLEWME